ncbi:Ataxin-1 [Taenia solium]|eukprot:TsM_001226500 transcript=TsM_001226500 gene=TsM_001226500
MIGEPWNRKMTLLPYQMPGSGNRLLHRTEDVSHFPANSILTPEQLIMAKALTASCSIFAPLLSQCQKRKSLQSTLSASCHPMHQSGLQRPYRPPSTPKRHSASTFQHSGKVRLPDGSVQKIESISFADFLQTAAPINAESLLQWSRVEQIDMERPLTACHREHIKIRFSLNPLRVPLCGKSNYHLPSVITFDHVCNREQPFFVRPHGWSSYDPYLTQTRCGLLCRQLSVGDFCLVIIPSEIARSPSHIPQVDSTSSNCTGKASPLIGRANEDCWISRSPTFQNCASQLSSSAPLPQQPLNLKKGSGAVPTYFTAASLAESPFNKKS